MLIADSEEEDLRSLVFESEKRSRGLWSAPPQLSRKENESADYADYTDNKPFLSLVFLICVICVICGLFFCSAASPL
jgi:hypothetical protein